MSALSVKGDNFYHVCIAKANTSPFTYLSLFYFVQSDCTLDFLRCKLLEKRCSGSIRRRFCNWPWKDYDPLQ